MRHRGVTHQLDLFITGTSLHLTDRRLQEGRLASPFHIGKIGQIHSKGVVQPVLFMTVTCTISRIAVVPDRTETPLVIIAGTVQRAFTELDGKPHRDFRRLCRVMNFHLDGFITGQILHIVFKDAGYPYLLTRIQILIIQNQGGFLQRGVGFGITFRLGVGGLGIDIGIFAVVDGGDLDAASVTGVHRFLYLGGYAVHFHHLGIFRRAGLVEVGHRGFLPGISHHSQTYNLYLGFSHPRIQATNPKS